MLDDISKNLREHTVNALLASGVKPAFESTPGCPDDVRSVCAWAVQGCRCQPRSTIKKIAKRVPNMCHERTVMFASLPEGTTGTTTSSSTAQRQERPGQSFRQKQLKRRVLRKLCFCGCGRCGQCIPLLPSAGNARRGGAEHRPQESQLGPQERRGEEAGQAKQEDAARDRRDHPRTHG